MVSAARGPSLQMLSVMRPTCDSSLHLATDEPVVSTDKTVVLTDKSVVSTAKSVVCH